MLRAPYVQCNERVISKSYTHHVSLFRSKGAFIRATITRVCHHFQVWSTTHTPSPPVTAPAHCSGRIIPVTSYQSLVLLHSTRCRFQGVRVGVIGQSCVEIRAHCSWPQVAEYRPLISSLQAHVMAVRASTYACGNSLTIPWIT
jgi:hypothetical protein